MNRIQRRRLTLEKRAQKIYDEMDALQESCPHADVDKKYRSDTGNWDKSNDCYWIEFRCPDCNKFWTETQ